MTRTRRRSTALWLALALCLLALPATAEDPAAGDESRWGYQLAHELMSPFCPGRTLAACPSEKAAELRQWILIQEAAGATREEVVATLESRYGEVIHSSPKAEGWGLAAWLLPAGALLAGAALAVLVLRRMVARPRRSTSPVPVVKERSPAPSAAPVDDAELERLVDAELAASER